MNQCANAQAINPATNRVPGRRVVSSRRKVGAVATGVHVPEIRVTSDRGIHDRIVDIGMPTHGQPRYLRDAIESVMSQTFRAWRLTISENGSEGTVIRSILAPYLSDPRVRLVATGKEVSPQENATRAIRAGHAPYVALLHDDDRWDPEFLARRVAFLDSHETCGFVFSHCVYIAESGDAIYRFTVDLREGVQPRSDFVRYLYRRNIIAMPTVLARRAAYEAVGPAFSESLLFDDWEMWLRMATRFDVGFVNAFDADYRLHPSQTSHAGLRRMGEHRLDFLNEVERWLPDDVPTLDRKRARSGAQFRASYDAFSSREWRRGLAGLVGALRIYPTAALDPKMAALAWAAIRFRVRQRAVWKLAPTAVNRPGP
jgi:glycosyltransferase involved in cell wall biosynthesis